MLDLAPLNEALRARGLRMQVEQRRQGLTARGTFPEHDGTCKRKRISLDIAATPASLVTAELRCLQLHNAIQQGTYPASLPWSTSVHASAAQLDTPLNCGAAIHDFEIHYWQVRPRCSASERTW